MAASVADASVLAALLFDEQRRAEAEELLAGADLFEPTLLPYELASVARKKIRLDPEQEEPVLRALELLAEVPFRWVVVDQRESVRLAVRTGLTTYDAAYLWTARSVGAQLVTFDARLQAAVGETEA